MEKDYRVYTIRRLFKEHLPVIIQCCSSFDFLHFNPLDMDYMEKTLLTGEIWGVFNGDEIIALTYMQQADIPPFASLNAAWEIADLLDCDLADSFLCGYLWTDGSCETGRLYSALTKLWALQAVHYGRQNIIHYMPAHIDVDFPRLFANGFRLVGLRGLDNIVPHWIFTRQAQIKTEDSKKYTDIKSCRLSDTITISMLCEHGYKGYAADRQKNLLFRR